MLFDTPYNTQIQVPENADRVLGTCQAKTLLEECFTVSEIFCNGQYSVSGHFIKMNLVCFKSLSKSRSIDFKTIHAYSYKPIYFAAVRERDQSIETRGLHFDAYSDLTCSHPHHLCPPPPPPPGYSAESS